MDSFWGGFVSGAAAVVAVMLVLGFFMAWIFRRWEEDDERERKERKAMAEDESDDDDEIEDETDDEDEDGDGDGIDLAGKSEDFKETFDVVDETLGEDDLAEDEVKGAITAVALRAAQSDVSRAEFLAWCKAAFQWAEEQG